MCDKAFDEYPWWCLEYVPDKFKTKEMCNKAVDKDPLNLEYVPDHFIHQEMCAKSVGRDPTILKYIPDHFKTQEMCDKAIDKYPRNLRYVPDWFITDYIEKIALHNNNNPKGYIECKKILMNGSKNTIGALMNMKRRILRNFRVNF